MVDLFLEELKETLKGQIQYYINMAFVQAMKQGINGADVYTEMGDSRVTLFTMLARGLEADYIKDHVEDIYSSQEKIRDLWVMAFQTRDIRGGKGERQLFYELVAALHGVDPVMTEKMLSLIPEYGCWRDLWTLWEKVPALEPAILALVREAYAKDLRHYRLDETSKMSLLAKWLPREKSKTFVGQAQKIAKALFPDGSDRAQMIQYRMMVSAMNRDLKTVEVKMCGKAWKTIDPAGVPGRCMKNCDKAFLNEPSAKSTSSARTSSEHTEVLRFPDDADRMACRANFQAFLEEVKTGKKKVHGANVIMPHELVGKLQGCGLSADQHTIVQGQWDSIREETLKAGGLGKAVAMCDFSGSMSGTPMEVSLALGILISEITHPAFRDHILTFDAAPQWHSFVGKKTLHDKVKSLRGCGQGLNTDFYAACMRILQRMIKGKVPVGEEPEDLIVITDMGFDAAASPHGSQKAATEWETQITRIRREFQEDGEKLWGKGQGWKPPRIVIWNVRAEFKDFHAKADQEGVVQLSGWSPSMLKALQNGVQVQTPYEGMRQILDDARYDLVRTTYAA